MKKILLSVAFLGATFIGAKAQQTTVIWNDDNFEGVWTVIDADGDGENWHFVNGGTAEDPDIWLRSFSYINNQGALTPDNYVISPVIDLTNETESISLAWKVAGQDPNYSDEKYSVYVAAADLVDAAQTAADIANAFLNSTVNFSETVTDNGPGGYANFYLKTLDISSLAGQTVYVAFRHHDSTDNFAILIDDVEVIKTTFSVENHLTSSFSVYPNPATDVLRISNTIGAEVLSVKITDINGRTIKEFEAISEMNIADLNSGVYFVNIYSSEGNLTKKIVKN